MTLLYFLTNNPEKTEKNGVIIYRKARMDGGRKLVVSMLSLLWLYGALQCVMMANFFEEVGRMVCFCLAGICALIGPWIIFTKAVRYEINADSVVIVRLFPFSNIVIPFDQIHDVATLQPKRDYSLREACAKLRHRLVPKEQIIFPFPKGVRYDPSNEPEYLQLGGPSTIGLRPPRPFRMKLFSSVVNQNCVVFISGKMNYAISPEHPDEFVEQVSQRLGH